MTSWRKNIHHLLYESIFNNTVIIGYWLEPSLFFVAWQLFEVALFKKKKKLDCRHRKWNWILVPNRIIVLTKLDLQLNEQIDIRFLCVCLHIDDKFHHNIMKVAVEIMCYGQRQKPLKGLIAGLKRGEKT